MSVSTDGVRADGAALAPDRIHEPHLSRSAREAASLPSLFRPGGRVNLTYRVAAPASPIHEGVSNDIGH
ncbi:MAG TPA: hypothetical protein VHY37_09195 [Tepidisphaeraceae bacterium]|jgi:hypothetical protein|nr:hypothetical protein [Tepidisphaeraceae bacterium]